MSVSEVVHGVRRAVEKQGDHLQGGDSMFHCIHLPIVKKQKMFTKIYCAKKKKGEEKKKN